MNNNYAIGTQEEPGWGHLDDLTRCALCGKDPMLEPDECDGCRIHSPAPNIVPGTARQTLLAPYDRMGHADNSPKEFLRPVGKGEGFRHFADWDYNPAVVSGLIGDADAVELRARELLHHLSNHFKKVKCLHENEPAPGELNRPTYITLYDTDHPKVSDRGNWIFPDEAYLPAKNIRMFDQVCGVLLVEVSKGDIVRAELATISQFLEEWGDVLAVSGASKSDGSKPLSGKSHFKKTNDDAPSFKAWDYRDVDSQPRTGFDVSTISRWKSRRNLNLPYVTAQYLGYIDDDMLQHFADANDDPVPVPYTEPLGPKKGCVDYY